jgi:hypothetical protein
MFPSHDRKEHGIPTYVVEEGARYSGNQWGHCPLRAEYFICLDENYDFWLEKGIPRERLQTHCPDTPPEYATTVVFLHPLYTRDNFRHPYFRSGKNVLVMRVIEHFLKRDRTVFKLHPKNRAFVERLIPKHKIIEGKAEDIIRMPWKNIYCFKESSIRMDCKMMGVKADYLEDMFMGLDTIIDRQ